MRKISYANVTSTLALVLAMAGGAYAASLADNSVGTRHIKDEAVTTVKVANSAVSKKKIKNAAVTAAKIKADTITAANIGPSAVSSNELSENAVDSTHILSNSIEASDLGDSARRVFGYERVQSPNTPLPAHPTNGGFGSASVDCPAGKLAVGGGHYMSHTDVEIVWSYAIDGDTWQVQARNPSGNSDRVIVAHVVCVNGG